MSTSTHKLSHELINIQIAIELDKGKTIAEVAEKFDLKISTVKAVSRELLGDKQQKKAVKKRRFSDSEAGLTEKTLRRWCKQRGVIVPRRLNQISLVERREVMELLNENNWRDIAHAYNISIDEIEEIATPPHSNLDIESLGFLFEILREQPHSSAKKLSVKAGEVGLSIPESAVSSYRKRLKLLGKI